MKVRVKYTRTGPLKFISHLDVMRYFQKNIRRAGLDIAYSTGLSPHQIISFAAPMPLMLTSVAEYFDAEFLSLPDAGEFIRRLNASGVPELKILDAAILPEKAENCMAAVTASDYRVSLTEKGEEEIGDKWATLMPQAVAALSGESEIVIEKKTKKNLLPVNIRPMIFELTVEDTCIRMLTSAGKENLKPEHFLPVLCQRMECSYDRFYFDLVRLETYTGVYGTDSFRPLIDIGERGFKASVN